MMLARYLISGTINSVLGLLVIMLCMAVFAMPILAANATGYAVGLCFSFFLHRRYTFRSSIGVLQGMAPYIVVVAISYLANVLVLLAAAAWLHVNPYVSQVLGVAAYVIVGFVGSKNYVFDR